MTEVIYVDDDDNNNNNNFHTFDQVPFVQSTAAGSQLKISRLTSKNPEKKLSSDDTYRGMYHQTGSDKRICILCLENEISKQQKDPMKYGKKTPIQNSSYTDVLSKNGTLQFSNFMKHLKNQHRSYLTLEDNLKLDNNALETSLPESTPSIGVNKTLGPLDKYGVKTETTYNFDRSKIEAALTNYIMHGNC